MTKTTKATKTKTTKKAPSPAPSPLLQGWTSAAAESLSKQGQRPFPVGRRGNSLAWRDREGVHTLVIDWYDEKARCVRLYIDHYTLTSKTVAKALGCESNRLRPSESTRLEITTLSEEMDAALVWALTGRSGSGPCDWVAASATNICSQAAAAAERRIRAPKVPPA
jgi:hypothetical protein